MSSSRIRVWKVECGGKGVTVRERGCRVHWMVRSSSLKPNDFYAYHPITNRFGDLASN